MPFFTGRWNQDALYSWVLLWSGVEAGERSFAEPAAMKTFELTVALVLKHCPFYSGGQLLPQILTAQVLLWSGVDKQVSGISGEVNC